MKLDVYGPAGHTTVFVDDDISDKDLAAIIEIAATEEHGNGLMGPRKVENYG